LVRRSPLALRRHRLGSRVITSQAPEKQLNVFPGSSPGLRLLSRGRPSTEPLHRALGFPKTRRSKKNAFSTAPPLRFLPLQRFPRPEQRHEWPGLPRPTACAFRFSQPLGAFIRPEPAGLVSCRIRSWGHPPEPCSSHAAARRSQRRSPHGVPTAFRVFLRARVRHSTQRFRLKPSA